MKIIQLSDLHLLHTPHARLWGLDTEETLMQVIDLLKQENDIDLLLLTGDLAEDGSPAAYQRLAKYIENLSYPAYWIPGNHDDRQALTTFLTGKNIRLERTIRYKSWNIILLDSLKQGQISGELSNSELTFLEEQLLAHKNVPTLIALHHHPVSVASKMIDQYPLENAENFWNLIANHSQVKLILCGHVHQDFRQKVSHTEVLSCPSTCMQFSPKADKLKFDQSAPGYRWIELKTDGTYRSGVTRIEHYSGWRDYVY